MQFIKACEAAKILGVSSAALSQQRKRGTCPFKTYNLAGEVLYRPGEVIAEGIRREVKRQLDGRGAA